MHSPTLNQLPPPPPGKTDWPWTEDSPQLPDAMPDGSPWPRVSIVTPSYNQAQFIEETIRSVLLQGYPNLEYIIIDGGSIDGSVEIIRKYEPWLAYWVSEKDNGQSHAINKGFERATGEWFAWLNSDDVYEPRVFSAVMSMANSSPKTALFHGDIVLTDQDGTVHGYGLTSSNPQDLINWMDGKGLAQPATFWRSRLFEEIGQLKINLRFIMDYEFFLRASMKHELSHIPHPLARFRIHPASKTSTMESVKVHEHMCVAKKNWAWISQYAHQNYWRRVRDHYGHCLVSDLLAQDSYDRRIAALGHLATAVIYAPSLIREQWIIRLGIKLILGRTATSLVRAIWNHTS